MHRTNLAVVPWLLPHALTAERHHITSHRHHHQQSWCSSAVQIPRSRTLYLVPVLMWGIRLQRYATGSLMALFRLDMLILNLMQLARPIGVSATISFQTAKLSSTALLRCLDSMPSIRSCTTRGSDSQNNTPCNQPPSPPSPSKLVGSAPLVCCSAKP